MYSIYQNQYLQIIREDDQIVDKMQYHSLRVITFVVQI